MKAVTKIAAIVGAILLTGAGQIPLRPCLTKLVTW